MIKQYVQQPYKVRAEQWDPAADPLQEGVDTCSGLAPHVHLANGTVWLLTEGDWIFRDLFQPEFQVMGNDEFSAKFGGGTTGV